MIELDAFQLTGRRDSHLVELLPGHRLQAKAAEAFLALREDAREDGFELAAASSFRSYDRQLAIWNGKACGRRKVHDDAGRDVLISALPAAGKLRAIMRYSAIPGTSRHHWGSDLDIYDAAAVPAGYQLELSPREVAPGGVFDRLHLWLDQRMAAGESRGFYRPYARDCGGVAPERWHLSYAPLAVACERSLTQDLLLACWGDCPSGEEPLLLGEEIRSSLPQIMADYVAVPRDWCPQHHRG